MKESLIGKYYLPYDNSYSVNLTSASSYPYKNEQKQLAGDYKSDAKFCLIVSEPFSCKVTTVLGDIRTVEMILVEYDNKTSSVMYFEHCVCGNKIMGNGIPIVWDDNG